MDWLETHLDLSDPGLWTLRVRVGGVGCQCRMDCAASDTGPSASGATAQVERRASPRLARHVAVLLLLPLFAWRYGAISPYLLGSTSWIGSQALGGRIADGRIDGASAVRMARLSPQAARRSGRNASHRRPADSRAPRADRRGAGPVASGILSGCCHRLACRQISAFTAPLPISLRESWQAQPLYWGSWLGLGVLLVESALNPLLWAVLGMPTQEERAGEDRRQYSAAWPWPSRPPPCSS